MSNLLKQHGAGHDSTVLENANYRRVDDLIQRELDDGLYLNKLCGHQYAWRDVKECAAKQIR